MANKILFSGEKKVPIVGGAQSWANLFADPGRVWLVLYSKTKDTDVNRIREGDKDHILYYSRYFYYVDSY